jgi:hypothetical protein
LQIETRPIDRLVPYVRNSRTHSEDQIAQIAASIAEFGFVNPVLIGADDMIVAGHGRVLAAKQLGMAEVPVIVLDHLSEAQRRALVIADNRIAESAGWDEAMLKAELAALRDEEFDLDLLGFSDDDLLRMLDSVAVPGMDGGADADDSGIPPAGSPAPEPSATLADRFGIPPFSVLDARKGWWQDRKRAWIDLGIRSELGRGAAPGGSPRPLDRGYAKAFHDGAKLGNGGLADQVAAAATARRAAKSTAAPGGSPLPAADYSKSKARGDGRGKAIGP